MTTLRILSDLHFEFHKDGGRAFVDALDVQPDEVLVCAGDLCNAAGVAKAIALLCDRFKAVFYVNGNHDYYGSHRGRIEMLREGAHYTFQNLHILDKDVIEFDGGRILGCPLWFQRTNAPKQMMNDFRFIRDFESWVYDENARCIEFLQRELREGDIVLTHYLPSHCSVAPRWKDSPLNPFFVCDVESLIEERKPALWVHGHTHDSVDYCIGSTRVLCNPYGYQDQEVNAAFDPCLRVQV